MRKKLVREKITLLMVNGIIFTFFAMGFITLTFAQEYPTQPITIVVGTGAGGPTDTGARIMSHEAKKLLGVDILVINKAGASHTVGMSYVISRLPDGYTLGAAGDAPYTRAPHMLKLDFNPLTDTLPILYYGYYPHIIVARGDSPFKTFKDAINFAKENPGKLTCGSFAVGSQADLNMAGLGQHFGIKIPMVVFPGDPEAIFAVLGGHIMVAGVASGTAKPHIKAGKLKILATTENERWEKYPEVPTLYELGYKDACPQASLGFYGPKGLPDRIVKKIVDTFTTAIESAEFKEFLQTHDLRPMKGTAGQTLTGQELRNYLVASNEFYGNLIRKFGVGKTKP